MHAHRRDGWWSLLAQVFASLFWFHPLAWWALPALRHDQELACDAAVLRKRTGCRRSYARAMLKTPAALQALPVGCSWSSRHPLTERIAMLKSPSPGLFRRQLGVFASLALSAAVTGVVYAASTPAAGTSGRAASGDRQYQLDIQLGLTREGARASRAARLHVALCMRAGQPARLQTDGIALEAITRPRSDQRVSIDLTVREKAGAVPVHSQLAGPLRQLLHASGTMPGGAERYAIDITPQPGCPAAAVSAAAGSQAPITMRVQGVAARQVVGWIATTAALVLVNPDAVDQRQVTLDFQQVPAASAMQMVADQDGLRAVFDGQRVRFEPKS